MGDEDYTEVELPDGATVRISNNIFSNNITTNRRNYWDYYDYDLHFNMEEFEFHPEPRRLNVTWTRITEEEFFKDDIERKAEKHRRNSRKHRTIRI